MLGYGANKQVFGSFSGGLSAVSGSAQPHACDGGVHGVDGDA
jgi:hypothetical protein